jgi:hypothetical protein
VPHQQKAAADLTPDMTAITTPPPHTTVMPVLLPLEEEVAALVRASESGNGLHTAALAGPSDSRTGVL